MHARRHPQAAVAVEGDTGRARDGLAFLAHDRELRVTLSAGIAALLFFSVSITAELFFVTDVLHAGETGFGLLLTSWTLGMVLGAVALARRVPPAAMAAAALLAIAIQGAGLAAAATASVLPPRSPASRSAASRTASRTSCCAR